MFGHDDNNTTAKEDHVNPEHDAVLDGSEPTTAPAVTDDSTSSPAYIPTPSASDDKADTVLPTPTVTSGADSDLLDIKQSALKMLTPLVGHLNQTPEEKFRTTMMMIQASDDQALIKDAYAAAQSISDEKTKAQALLDIINEINYFTQQS